MIPNKIKIKTYNNYWMLSNETEKTSPHLIHIDRDS